jgi:quinol monooxygenase YgiN
MSEIVVVVHFHADEGRGADGLAALGDLSVPTHAEQGCLAFALHTAADDPDHIVLIERWASRAALDEHLATEHLAAFRAGGADIWSGPPGITVLDPAPAPAGDPAKASLAGG